MGCGKAVFDFTIIIYLAFLGIDQENLTRLEASLLGNFLWVEVHHTHLGCHHHHVVLGDGVTGRTQTVAVEQSAGVATVAEEQGGRTIPWLHQDGVILIERLEVLGDRILVIEALRYHDCHCVRQRQTTHHEELKHVV